MKTILQLEEAAMFGFCIYALSIFQVDWWVYLILILGPDLSMIGYMAGNSIGAFSYNLFHHKAIAVAVFVTGFILKIECIQVMGIILFGHSSMDRMFGYGLKLKEGFKHTHLGMIGKK